MTEAGMLNLPIRDNLASPPRRIVRRPIYSELREWSNRPPWKGVRCVAALGFESLTHCQIPPAPSVIGVARLAYRPGAANREESDHRKDLSNRCAELQQGRSKNVVTG